MNEFNKHYFKTELPSHKKFLKSSRLKKNDFLRIDENEKNVFDYEYSFCQYLFD